MTLISKQNLMDRIFKIDFSVDPEVAGDTPQAYFPETEIDREAAAKLYRMSVEEVIEKSMEIPVLHLNDKSQSTDLLRTTALNSASGYVISKKFLDVLTTFGIPKMSHIPCSVKGEREVLDYYWVNLGEITSDNTVDYKASTFVAQPSNTKVNVSNESEFAQKSNELTFEYLECTDLRLRNNPFESAPVVKFGLGDFFWYCDGHAAKELRELSGCNITPVSYIYW